MRVYFSGIGGVAIGPLAEIACDAGYEVLGSDLEESLMTTLLKQRGITMQIGPQSGELLRREHEATPIDWFVYTAALPHDHPELVAASELGIRAVKRDGFLAEFLHEKNLQLIAISGPHGKTTTTVMMVWAMQQLGVPVSYSLGTTISFGPSGAYDPSSNYFIYECDEFDRNMLKFHPYLSLLTSLDYDHPDTYPTEKDYTAAFSQFLQQSKHTIGWEHELEKLADAPSGLLRSNEAMNHSITSTTHDSVSMDRLGAPADRRRKSAETAVHLRGAHAPLRGIRRDAGRLELHRRPGRGPLCRSDLAISDDLAAGLDIRRRETLADSHEVKRLARIDRGADPVGALADASPGLFGILGVAVGRRGNALGNLGLGDVEELVHVKACVPSLGLQTAPQLRVLLALDQFDPSLGVANELLKFGDGQAQEINRHAEFPLTR